MKRGDKTKASKDRRKKTQRAVAQYQKLREDLQLAGKLPTEPAGAVRDERVDPARQQEQQLPTLVADAVRNGWAVPEHVKPKIVDKLIEPFISNDVVLDKDGVQVEVPPDRYLLKENAKVLGMLDQRQYERDNPDAAGRAKGGVKIDNTVNAIDLGSLLRAVDERKRLEEGSIQVLEGIADDKATQNELQDVPTSDSGDAAQGAAGG